MARAMARQNVAEAVQLFHARRDDFTQLCNVIEMVRNDLEIDIPRAWVSHTPNSTLWNGQLSFGRRQGTLPVTPRPKENPLRNPFHY